MEKDGNDLQMEKDGCRCRWRRMEMILQMEKDGDDLQMEKDGEGTRHC